MSSTRSRHQRRLLQGTLSEARAASAIERLESRMLLSASANTAGVLLAPVIPLSSTTWTPIGPAPSTNGNIAGNGPVSGRVTGIAADPTDPNTVYLASAGGGVWKTVNAGASWTPLTDTQSVLFLGAIAVAPTNSSIIYAATGDSTNSTQSFYGKGILTSTNGGSTWTLLGNSVFNRKTISQIVVDPTNANIVYAASAGGGTNGTSGGTGIWKSTNGGVSWTNTTTAISTTDRFTDLQIDPTNPLRLLCARSGTAGIYATTNGGASWTLVGGGLPSGAGIVNPKVAISPSNPQVVYVAYGRSDSHLLGIWKSTDGGASWSMLPNTPDYLGGNAFYSSTLAVDPHDANIVYAGGVAGMLQSTDGGLTWTDITVGAGGTTGTHWDHHADVFDASGRLLDGTDGGIWRLDNATPGSISWDDLNTNLQISTFLSGALDPSDPNNAFAVGQDNGITQFPGSTAWTQRDIGPGPNDGTVLIDAQNPSRVYHQVANTDAGPQNFIRRSDDGGTTWTGITNGIDPTEAQSFYAGFAIDPSNGNHLVYGTDRVYETYDGGNTWTPISTPNANGWTAGPTSTVAKLAIAATDPHTIYATDNGHVFVTQDGGATWIQRDPLNNSFGGLVVDPDNAQIAYTLGGVFGVAKVMRTVDAGATWQNISTSLPDLPTYALAINNGTLYVGNDNGVFTSTDDGTTWSRFGAGMPNAEVRDLEFNPATNTLAAFTYGRGAWEISTTPSAPLVVNTLLDETTPGDGLLSLREAVATSNTNGQSILLDPSLAAGTINLDPANGALIISRSTTISAPAGKVTINTAGFPVEAAGSNTIRLNNFSFTSSGGPAIQIDSPTLLNLQNASSTADISDNGRFSLYQFADGEISGAISGSGNLSKFGPFTLRLSGNNSYAGQTAVNGGVLAGSTAVLKGNLFVGQGATLAFDQSSLPGNDGSFSGTVIGSGTVRVFGPASIVRAGTFGAGSPSTIKNSGPTVIDAGAALVATASNNLGLGAWIVNGNFDLGGFDQTFASLAGTGTIYNLSAQPNPLATLTVGNSVNTTFSGVIEDAPAGSGSSGVTALKKVGTDQLTLAGTPGRPSTYTGGTTIVAGSLQGNTLGLEGNIVGNPPSTQVTLTFDQSLGGINDGTFSGVISGNVATTINNGTVRLAPASSLNSSQITTINGTLVAGAANDLGFNQILFVNGTLDLGGFDQGIALLFGNGTILNNEPAGLSGTATITLGVTQTGSIFTGIIEDHTPNTSNGGTLALNLHNFTTLTGANTYSGGTTLSSGQLTVGLSSGDPLGTGPIVMAGGSISLQGQTSAPLEQPIAVTGFNEDVIVDASANDPVSSTTTSVDSPGPGGSYDWYEQGFGAADTGLPAGATFQSLINPNVTFQFQPAAANNVALLTSSTPLDLALTQPGHFASLHFLAASANGSGTFTAKLNFADGTSTNTTAFVVPDWFNGSSPAFIAGGRVFRLPGGPAVQTPGNPRFYEFDFNLTPADQLKVLSGVTLSETGSQRIGIYALSGAGLTLLSSQSYPNPVVLNADAPIDIQNSSSVSFGDLTIGNNTLSITAPTGEAVSFASVHLTADHIFDVPGGMTFTLGSISDGGAGYSTGLTDSGTLVFVGTNTYNGSTSVTTGTLLAKTAGAFPAHTALTITGNGTVQFPSTGPSFTATIGALSIDPGSKLDIGNKAVFINYAANPDPTATVRNYLKSGYDAGNWDGLNAAIPSGAIVSSAAASDPRKGTAVGYRDVINAIHNGAPAHTVWLKYTLYGDANLDGTVNLLDLATLLLNFGRSGRQWEQGDFNYDGMVNLADLQALAMNFGMTTSVTPAATQAMAAIQSASAAPMTQQLASGKSKLSRPKHHARLHH